MCGLSENENQCHHRWKKQKDQKINVSTGAAISYYAHRNKHNVTLLSRYLLLPIF